MTQSFHKRLLLLCFLTAINSILFCQIDNKIKFTTINNTDGLSNNTVNTIAKDDLGFVWIGTNDGLCRYEAANNIKVFRVDNPKIEGGLQSSDIRVLFLDNKNNLWIGTRLGGLTKFHQPSGTWKTYRHDKNNDSSISNDEILAITADSKGQLWIGTEDGLNVFNYEKEAFVSFKGDPKNPTALKGKAVLSVLEDNEGRIWVGTWAGGLNLLIPAEDGNIENASFRTFLPNEQSEAQHIWEIYQDKQNRIWIGSWGAGLFLMELPEAGNNDLTSSDWKPHFHNYAQGQSDKGVTNEFLYNVFQDSKGNLWIATINGLNLILANDLLATPQKRDTSTKPEYTFHHYFYEHDNPNALANNDVSTIFEDTQGLLWFGTFSGISLYNWYINQFDVFEIDDITNTNTQNFYIDKQEIGWIGNGKRGIFKYDFQKRAITDFVNKKKIPFLADYATAMYSPDDKYLYIGASEGISVLEMETAQVKNYPFPDNITKFNSFIVRSLLKERKNNLWIASGNGLFLLDEATGTYTSYLHDPENSKSISDNAINQMVKDSNGDTWISTFNGLNKVEKTLAGKIEFKRFKHDPSEPKHSIPSNRLKSLKEINGILYIGSNSGLCGYDLKEKTFINYSKNNNNHNFQSIEKTKDGHLWASTTEGIVFFNTKTKTFNQYDKGDGLGDLIYQTTSSHTDKNGFMYFGSRRGITRFNPQDLKKNEIPPPVYVMDVRKMSPDGEEQLTGTYQKEITLNANDYFLSLDYAALNYNRSEKNQYAYMLEGFEEKWNYLDKKSPAIYTNLQHGSYTFKVKAANNDGIWNEEGATLKIIKKPAFWETWWFKIACSSLALALLFFGMKYYTRNINERNKTLQKYNENLNKYNEELNKEITQRKVVETALQKQKLSLRESNEKLQRSNKDLEQFAYIASHDLQEPLGVVGNFIGLLKLQYKEQLDENAFQYIDFAVNGVTQMSERIRSILTFSGINKNDIEFQLTNLEEVIAASLQDLSQKIKEKNVQFKIDPLPEISCDKPLMKMVFHNLISNAIKFNSSKKPLIIIAYDKSSPKGFWQFSVKDNGIGIHQKYQTKIFEIFKRLHNKKDYEGTGIGLALCQKIIHKHGGRIWMESKEAEGATFYFTISKHLTKRN